MPTEYFAHTILFLQNTQPIILIHSNFIILQEVV